MVEFFNLSKIKKEKTQDNNFYVLEIQNEN